MLMLREVKQLNQGHPVWTWHIILCKNFWLQKPTASTTLVWFMGKDFSLDNEQNMNNFGEMKLGTDYA